MSTYSDASLILPVAPERKAGKIYSLKPTDGTGDFDFSRPTTATRVNEDGLIETVGSNIPRLNYPMIDGVVSGCPSLLLEPQRTNYFQQSNQFDTTWQISAVGITVTPNQVGVGNSQDAWKLTEGTFDGDHFIRQTPNVGGVVSISVYAKAGTNDFVYFRGVTGLANKRTWFNLSNGTVGTSEGISAEMISMGNGWYRCVMVLDHQTAFEYYIGTSNADGVSSYQGNNNYIFIQNAQLEQGSYATSYIPTQGSAVTRDAETCNGAGDANTFNDSEGVLFAEISALANDGTTRVISINDNSGSNVIRMGYTASINEVNFIVRATTNIYSYSQVLGDITTINKIAISYNSSEAKVFINGILSDSGALSSLPIGLSQLDFRYGNGTLPFYGNTKQVQYFDTALTDQELISLTS